MTKQELNYWMIYHEIHQMKRDGSSMRRICQKLALNFRTVKKYLSMSEQEFFQRLESQKHRYKKLAPYEDFVKGKLDLFPETKAAQMHDWLKENYVDFPTSCEKTVYNFVMYVRQKYSIPLQPVNRDFFPVEELHYGYQAQVDFGEYTMRTCDGSRKKVYFFSMVLSRSRHKYVCFSTRPFTTQMAILAHEKAFDFFQGIPELIVYDQDSVFLHNENYGSLLLTKEFKAYANIRNLTLHFCRKADPQSKGKIESVIKYIKQNFLYNRTFIDIDTLNDQALNWLSRTANIMVHHRTRKVPFSEWQIEKQYLKTYFPMPIDCNPYLPYCVRKDNTIAYKSNFYTLPEGTYKGKGTDVLIRVEEENIHIYTREKKLICTHMISNDKGRIIRNTDHKRDKEMKIHHLLDQIAGHFKQTDQVKKYLEMVRKTKPRYIRDQLMIIRKTIESFGSPDVFKAIEYCHEHSLYDAISLKSIVEKIIKSQDHQLRQSEDLKLLVAPENLKRVNAKPLASNIDDYENLLSN